MIDYSNEIIDRFQLDIESKFGTVANFCKQKNFDRFGLSKLFNKRKALTVGMFFRLSTALDYVSKEKLSPDANYPDTGLFDYLKVDHDLITKLLLNVLLA